MNKWKHRSIRIAVLAFGVSMLITQAIAYLIYIVDRENARHQVIEEANRIKDQLQTSLSYSITTAKVLDFVVEQNLVSDFDTLSDELLQQNQFIDAIQLVINRTIVKTYPMKGNEATIGYEVLRDSAHWEEARKALMRNELYFEGPINLIQGGRGIVGRLPIFKKDTLFGYSAVVIRMETFFKALGIESSGENDFYSYQMAKFSDGRETTYFFEDKRDYSEGIYHKVFIPEGDWNIYVKLKNPDYLGKTVAFALMGLFFSIVLAWFVANLLVQPEKLKRQVELKTRDLDRANKALCDSNKELEEFAYIASHDLQEPLRMITGFLHQLEKKYQGQLDEKANQYIYFAVDGAERMRMIITDLLKFSRVGGFDGEKELVNLQALLEDYKTLRSGLILEKGAKLLSGPLPEILSHKAPLIQIFHNLLDNAMKYNREGVNPEIRISVADEDDFWKFSIADNGIGIEKESYEKIFIIFRRLHSKDKYEGNGLGLAIVKKIVKALGGDVWVESQVNVGSTFYFTLKK